MKKGPPHPLHHLQISQKTDITCTGAALLYWIIMTDHRDHRDHRDWRQHACRKTRRLLVTLRRQPAVGRGSSPLTVAARLRHITEAQDSYSRQRRKNDRCWKNQRRTQNSPSRRTRRLFGNAKLLQLKLFSGDKRQTQETLHTWLCHLRGNHEPSRPPEGAVVPHGWPAPRRGCAAMVRDPSKELPVADLLDWDGFLSDINGPSTAMTRRVTC